MTGAGPSHRMLKRVPLGGASDTVDRLRRDCALVAALDGDGCSEGVVWRDGVLVRPDGSRYRIGRSGDQLVLGDWDCDRRDTAALYRASTGEVFLFTGWAQQATPLVTRVRSHAANSTGLTAAGCVARPRKWTRHFLHPRALSATLMPRRLHQRTSDTDH